MDLQADTHRYTHTMTLTTSPLNGKHIQKPVRLSYVPVHFFLGIHIHIKINILFHNVIFFLLSHIS